MCLTLCNPMDCSTPGFPASHLYWSLPKFMSIELMLSNHMILCHPLLLPSIFPNIRVFSNESVAILITKLSKTRCSSRGTCACQKLHHNRKTNMDMLQYLDGPLLSGEQWLSGLWSTQEVCPLAKAVSGLVTHCNSAYSTQSSIYN